MKYVIKRADGLYAVDVRIPPSWSRDVAEARRFGERKLAEGQIRIMSRQVTMPHLGMTVEEVPD